MYIFELKKAEITEVGDGAMRRLDGNDELDELHRLGAEEIHGWTATTSGIAHCWNKERRLEGEKVLKGNL